MSKNSKVAASVKLEEFIISNRKIVVLTAVLLIAAVIAVCAVFAVADSVKQSDLSSIDSIEFAYVSKSADISEEEAASRQAKAEEALVPYLSKKGVAGVRANMLAADISFAKSDFSKALGYYKQAADACRKAYTYAECMYNAAVCAEELSQSEEAVKFYIAASEPADFYLASHALFNAARVSETSGDFKKASELYQKTVDNYSGYEWADLSQSRLIDLKAKGKID
ncbi:tetratricopeptide repeat protein [Treponema sp.]|uniref:tetratricopeptide repeat protein n=1 Tax=Treponema sp. TaxID=166 RepID=UPI003F0A3840